MPITKVMDKRKVRRGLTVKPGTVKIYKSGTARIAGDLIPEDWKNPLYKLSFTVWEKGHVTFYLEEVKGKSQGAFYAWQSNEGCRSLLVSFTSTIREAGLKIEDVIGEYQAMKNGDRISFNYIRKGKKVAV